MKTVFLPPCCMQEQRPLYMACQRVNACAGDFSKICILNLDLCS